MKRAAQRDAEAPDRAHGKAIDLIGLREAMERCMSAAKDPEVHKYAHWAGVVQVDGKRVFDVGVFIDERR